MHTSCGVACVAMLARLSYRDAFRVGTELWTRQSWEGNYRTDAAELRAMLAEVGWRLGRKVRCKTWRKIPSGALVAVHKKRNNGWHWVVSDSDDEGPFFYDPRKSVKTCRRRDFQSVPPAWYHRVYLS